LFLARKGAEKAAQDESPQNPIILGETQRDEKKPKTNGTQPIPAGGKRVNSKLEGKASRTPYKEPCLHPWRG